MPRPRTHDSDNCWSGVTDPKKRKQIQDRLAQRARRQRLAAKHHDASSKTTSASSATSAQDRSAPAAAARQVPHTGTLALAFSIPPSPSTLSAGVVIPQTPAPVLDPAPDLHPDIPPTVYAALFTNGIILSIPCAYASPFPSTSPPCPDAPPDLQPTALQLSTPHARWIDRFPFPRMRDNFILLTVGEGEGVGAVGVLDQEALLEDLFCMESFVIREGGKAWEGADWTIGRGFEERWGWLFC
ncbi:hypothetical protein V502_05196 [Pseudogymnoascus sp. VKM F-4520 (FW-2644)]|nr:hypothetical protein V502_05196 [Pseudogymnoascus sp. VKM F-4520 (FW-2644)]